MTPTSFAILTLAVVTAGAGVWLVLRRPWERDGPPSLRRNRVRWRRQINEACQESFTIVDLAVPASPGAPPPAVELSSIGQRLGRLDDRLERLRIPPTETRISEAAVELRQVARGLAAALDAGRAIRVEAAGAERLRQSAELIAARAAEQELATRELSWLIEREDDG